MKKFLAFMMALAMVFCMAACGNTANNENAGNNESNVSDEDTVGTEGNNDAEEIKPETITIQALNANKEMDDIEVPYDPQRIAILDMPALEEIAPVVHLAVDYEKGVVESTRYNAQTIASIFGKEAEVDALFTEFQPRIDALNTVLNGKNVLLGMYNSNALGLMDTESQLNIIAKELGANNLGETAALAGGIIHIRVI